MDRDQADQSVVEQRTGRRVRVLLISHECQYPSESRLKADRLLKHGIDLRILVPHRWKHIGRWRQPTELSSLSRHFQVGRVRWPWMGPAQAHLHHYPNLAAELLDFRPDIIDLWEEPWGLVSAHACWLRRRVLPTAKIISETEYNLDADLPFPFERFRRFTLRCSDYLIGRSADAVRVAERKGYNGPNAVIPAGVEDAVFRPMDRGACRTDLGIDGFLVGFTGRVVAEKGLLDLVDALPLCPSDVKLVLVGKGRLKPALKRRAKDLRVLDRIIFIPHQPPDRLARIINALDVVALPSRGKEFWKEQYGRSILEAHACGVPVIGTDSGSIPDLIGSAGLTSPEGRADGLAKNICMLRSNPDVAAAMGELGRTQVARNQTWDRIAEKMKDIYLTVHSNSLPVRAASGQSGADDKESPKGRRARTTKAVRNFRTEWIVDDDDE